MKPDLRGFRALITGGSSGLGFEMSRALLSHGATVAIAARGGDKLDSALAKLRETGDAYAIAMDVRDEQSVDSAARWVRENWGRLDMLVNNAGIGLGALGADFAKNPGPFYKIAPEAFYNIVETNFIGYFLVARAFVPIMAEQGRGRLVNVSTSIPTMTARGQIPYGPARAGAEAMSRILTEELRELNIMVNVLLPGGATDTGLVPDGMREQFLARGLLKPDVMNDAILFLASPEAEGLTGERIIGKEFRAWLREKGFEE